ncbi:MAG: hypothetical protein ACKOKB_02835, partial [Bacteroidota bacterium]
MSRAYIVLILAAFVCCLGISSASAQCVPNTTYTGAGIYPDTLPNATAGVAYNQDVTFVMLT